jgi:hypothetical protein
LVTLWVTWGKLETMNGNTSPENTRINAVIGGSSIEADM